MTEETQLISFLKETAA